MMAQTITLRAHGNVDCNDARFRLPAWSRDSMYFISPACPAAIHSAKWLESGKSTAGAMPASSNPAAVAARFTRSAISRDGFKGPRRGTQVHDPSRLHFGFPGSRNSRCFRTGEHPAVVASRLEKCHGHLEPGQKSTLSERGQDSRWLVAVPLATDKPASAPRRATDFRRLCRRFAIPVTAGASSSHPNRTPPNGATRGYLISEPRFGGGGVGSGNCRCRARSATHFKILPCKTLPYMPSFFTSSL